MATRPLQVWLPFAGLLLSVAAFTVPARPLAAFKAAPAPIRFTFTIDSDAPLESLLPTPPKTAWLPPAPWNNDLSKVPEVSFGEPVSRDAKNAMEQTAHILAKINHLNRNRSKTDGFMEALLSQRDDLRGMPFLLGDDCRANKQQAEVFANIVGAIRREFFGANLSERPAGEPFLDAALSDAFWDKLAPKLTTNALREAIREADPDVTARVDVFQPLVVAALMQMITPASEIYGPRLPRHLATIPHAAAGRALAKLVLFSPDARVRRAAIDGLKTRRSDEYTDELLAGFRYPLPAAAHRSAEAFIKLGRKDMLAKLIDVLEQPDPRAPHAWSIAGQNVHVLRELVRVNHHRNCVLCHAPANDSDPPSLSLSSEVPMPDQPLRVSTGYYRFHRSPDILVRFDVTYLRQDFSLVLPVKDSNPWRAEQRFDFFVRTRVISDDEAAECERQLRKTPQPYHAAALQALRVLTGRNVGLAPQSWRDLLTNHAADAPLNTTIAPAVKPAGRLAPSAPSPRPRATSAPASDPAGAAASVERKTGHGNFNHIHWVVGTVFSLICLAILGLVAVVRMR
jgi:hypothetical protein